MFILIPVAAAAVLVFLGYIAIWSATQPTTPKGVHSFGKILAIILFVIAGLTLLSPMAARRFHAWQAHRMMEYEGRRAFGGGQGPWMHRMPGQEEKTQPGTTQEEKPQAPPSK